MTRAFLARRAAEIAAACLAVSLLAAPDAPAAGAQSTTDYDDDGDGLIEVATLAQLHAVRWDLDGDGDVEDDAGTTGLNERSAYDAAFPGRDASAGGRMGCPSGVCTGYELDADLNFDQNGDRQVTQDGDPDYWNGGAGWEPIGEDSTNPYAAAFDGNHRTISHLYVNRPDTDSVGLFGATASSSSVSGVRLAAASVTGRDYTGGLVGDGGGTIAASYVTGEVSGQYGVGGLAGYSVGDIAACWSSAAVSAATSGDASIAYTESAGGLVGELDGASIRASYAAGAVSGGLQTGGLVGVNVGGGVAASYALGPVAGGASGQSGGLVGRNDLGDETYADSYWDTGTTGQTTSAGGAGKTTRDLQRPTGYTGVYANWNLNLDGADGGDVPWDLAAAAGIRRSATAAISRRRSAPPGSRPTTGTPPSSANPSSPASAARRRARSSPPPPRSPPATA